MRSLKDRLTLKVMGMVVFLTACLIGVFYFCARSITLTAEATRARNDLEIAEELIDLKYPGPWRMEGEELYKGKTCINNNNELVDSIKRLTGDTCNIYMNNICVASTVREGDCDRAVGAYAPQDVAGNYLVAGQCYTGQAVLAGEAYRTAYKPIATEDGQIIGVLYLGVPDTSYNGLLFGSIRWMGLAGLVLSLLAGAVTRYAVRLPEPVVVGDGLRQVDEEVEYPLRREPTVGVQAGENEMEGDDPLPGLPQELPKGLNRVTLKQIALFLKREDGRDVTVKEVSKALGLSKVTTRRYFDYLEENGLVEVRQKYGSVGRPLRIYKFLI